jgi:hypothetical protein
MDAKMTIHYRGKPDGTTLATVILVESDSSVPRFYRHTLGKGVDPVEAYYDVASVALEYLDKHKAKPKPCAKTGPKARVLRFQAVLPVR